MDEKQGFENVHSHEKACTTDETFALFSKFFTHLFKYDGIYYGKEIEREKTLISELINRHLHNIHVLGTGSTIEGTHLPGSDVDQMYIVENMLAFFDKSDIVSNMDTSKYSFLVKTGAKYTCYVKLELCLFENYPDVQEIQNYLEEVGSERYLSSKKYRNQKVIPEGEKLRSSYGFTSKFLEHGPCGQTEMTFNVASDNSKVRNFEITEGIKCFTWPSFADEWIKRDRKSGWPSEHLIKKLGVYPVFVVPVGNPKSEDCNLEWRLSFAAIERELIWNFSETQFHCFYILKCISKFYLEPIVEDELSTYHVKTIMLWLSEDFEWKSELLLSSVVAGLEILRTAISKRCLEHYILRTHNLFYNKFENAETRKAVIDKIQSLVKHFVSAIMECKFPLQPETLKKRSNAETLIQKKEDLVAILELFDMESDRMKEDKYFLKYSAAFGIMLTVSRQYTDGNKLTELLEAMDKVAQDLSDPTMFFIVKVFVMIRLGMLYHLDVVNISDPSTLYFEDGVFQSDFVDSSDPNESIIRFEAAKGSFDIGCQLDQMAGYLYKATFLFIQNDIDQMKVLLKDLLGKNVILQYLGLCSSKEGLRVINEEVLITDEGPKIQTDRFPAPVCYDVIFTGNDVRCVPNGVKFECELHDYADGGYYFLYHPAVLAYYLLYEMHVKLDNETEKISALQHLADITEILKEENDGHKALNLLGYCLSRESRIEEAFNVLKSSLKICSSPQNAAAYHMCILILQNAPVLNNEPS